MIQLYTIGFTGKTAEKFFALLKKYEVKTILDTRLNTSSQLAGYAKNKDLEFFAREIGHINYEHNLDLAPTKDLLKNYRAKKISWVEYESAYLNLLDIRKIGDKIKAEQLHGSCLLCSEHSPEKCHRRLLAEYLKSKSGQIEIVHLQ